jgi:hypothetical protein
MVVVATGHTRDLDFGISSITPGLIVEHPASRYHHSSRAAQLGTPVCSRF